MNKFLIAIVAAALLSGCAGKQNAENTPAEANQQEATQSANTNNVTDEVSFAGIYEGTLPAASSSGIKKSLTLNKDNSCTLRSEYIDEKDDVFNDKGTYAIKDSVLTVTIDDGEEEYYLVEEGQLRMLNKDKKQIEGALAEYYILKQTEKF